VGDFSPLPFDDEAAARYGTLVALTLAANRSPKPLDLMIAAVASVHGLPLYTRNADDFVGLDSAVRVVSVRDRSRPLPTQGPSPVRVRAPDRSVRRPVRALRPSAWPRSAGPGRCRDRPVPGRPRSTHRTTAPGQADPRWRTAPGDAVGGHRSSGRTRPTPTIRGHPG